MLVSKLLRLSLIMADCKLYYMSACSIFVIVLQSWGTIGQEGVGGSEGEPAKELGSVAL